MGGGTDNVYADIQGLIFHSDLYEEGPGSIGETIRANSMKLEKELDLLQQGKISSTLRKKIERGVNLAAEDWESNHFESRQSAQRYIDEATQLQVELLNGGENASNIRGLNARLVKLMTSDYIRGSKSIDEPVLRNGLPSFTISKSGQAHYKTRSRILNLPVMPFSQRNSIDTEGRFSTKSGTSAPRLGDEIPSTRRVVGADFDLDLFQFRLQDHKFLVPDPAAEKLYQAFGGFDLDDKVISDLNFIRDSSGAQRLAAFIWRQPTGPQEFALMFPHLDESTITRLLGSETQFSQRFQALSAASSDLISEHVNKRIPNAKVGVTAGELDQLTRQEKVIKYVSLIANGNRSQAKKYVQGLDNYNSQSFFDEVEKAIFQIINIGQMDEAGLELSERGTKIALSDILARVGDGSPELLRDKAGNVLDDRLIYMPELPKKILQKAMSGKFGTMLNLTENEMDQLAIDSPIIGAQYRQSSFFKLFESKLSVGDDLDFIADVKNVMIGNESALGVSGSVDEMFENVANQVRNSAGSRYVSDTEVAYRIAGKLLKSDTIDEDSVLKTRVGLANLFNRQQFKAFGADDGLGVYVNKLGFAASLDNQRAAAIEELENMLARSDAGSGFDSLIRQRLNKLKTATIAIYSPESAIDPALGGGGAGGLRAGGTVEELVRSVRAYVAASRNFRCRYDSQKRGC